MKKIFQLTCARRVLLILSVITTFDGTKIGAGRGLVELVQY
jgi:hypothetical protein